MGVANEYVENETLVILMGEEFGWVGYSTPHTIRGFGDRTPLAKKLLGS